MNTPTYQDVLDRAKRYVAEHPDMFTEESRFLARQRDAELLMNTFTGGFASALVAESVRSGKDAHIVDTDVTLTKEMLGEETQGSEQTMTNTTLSGLTVGRMVHYVTRQGQHYPAIVTEVTDAKAGIVCLAVFDPQARGTHFVDGVAFDPHGAQTESWHWPERAD